MIKPVVITRPYRQAIEFLPRLSQIGRKGVLFPLFEIFPLLDDTELKRKLAQITNYATIIFVSPNAIHSVLPKVNPWPQVVGIGVMGAGSLFSLKEYGLNQENALIYMPKKNGPMDSESLFAAMPISELKGKSVLIIRGEHGRDWLREALQNEGILVEQVASYRREVPVWDLTRAELLCDLLEQPSDWVITSSEGLNNLVEMVVTNMGRTELAKLQRQSIWVPHKRIAEKAKECGFQDITLTGSGDENVLAALQWRVR